MVQKCTYIPIPIEKDQLVCYILSPKYSLALHSILQGGTVLYVLRIPVLILVLFCKFCAKLGDTRIYNYRYSSIRMKTRFFAYIVPWKNFFAADELHKSDQKKTKDCLGLESTNFVPSCVLIFLKKRCVRARFGEKYAPNLPRAIVARD